MKVSQHLGWPTGLLIACFLLQVKAFALSLADPIPFVYSSYGGNFLARVEPGEDKSGGKKAMAQLFKYNAAKRQYEKGLSIPLENQVLPEKLLITEDGTRFVGVGDWWNFDYENPVIMVYGDNGKVLKRFRIEDFLSNEEVAAVKKKTGGMPARWAEEVVLVTSSSTLRVIRDWVIKGPGKKYDNLLIDLKTLKVRKGEYP